MKMELNFARAQARLENLVPEYAGDPRTIEGADASMFDADLYDKADDGRYVLNVGKRTAALQELQSLKLQADNERLTDEANRRTVVDELRRSLQAAGVKPGLTEAAAALFMQTHRFAIGDDGKVRVLDRYGSTGDCLQAAVRWIERDEHGDLKGRREPDGRGEFTRMIDALRQH